MVIWTIVDYTFTGLFIIQGTQGRALIMVLVALALGFNKLNRLDQGGYLWLDLLNKK